MKVFLIKAFLFSAIILSVLFLVSYINRPATNIHNDYMAAIIDKHDRLAETDGRRLLLVGGSNLAFGINSERLEKEFQLPVVNMGLHAGLGHEFIINEAISQVRKGDVLILSLEYSLYNPDKEPDVALIDHTQEIYPAAEAYYSFSLKNWESLFYGNFKRALEKSKIDTTTVYNRKSFNKWGDVIAHLDKKGRTKLIGKGKWNNLTVGNTKLFYKLSDKCKAVGAKLFIVFPDYPRSEYELNEMASKTLEAQIRKEISFIPIICTPETFVMDDTCFFDTVYHLNKSGREMRTDKLIALLRNTLPAITGL